MSFVNSARPQRPALCPIPIPLLSWESGALLIAPEMDWPLWHGWEVCPNSLVRCGGRVNYKKLHSCHIALWDIFMVLFSLSKTREDSEDVILCHRPGMDQDGIDGDRRRCRRGIDKVIRGISSTPVFLSLNQNIFWLKTLGLRQHSFDLRVKGCEFKSGKKKTNVIDHQIFFKWDLAGLGGSECVVMNARPKLQDTIMTQAWHLTV